MQKVKFLAYSDIHHASKAARCLVLEDTLTIERAIHHRVATGGFDFSVFIGDRFLKREPEDEVKVKSDRVLSECMLLRPHIPHFHLIGNHDWTLNNRSWHTSESLKGYPGLIILDTPQTVQATQYAIHALPADVPYSMETYTPHPTAFNLLLFHGMVKGSLMSDHSDRVFEDGIDISLLDRPEWNFVLGGDIHVPQPLPFRNTRGGYAGAVCQRDRADADCQRGWLEVEATCIDNVWSVETKFVPTRNFFHKESFVVGPTTTYTSCALDERFVPDQSVEVTLTGAREDVDRIAGNPKWSNYEEIFSARNLDIIRDYKVEQLNAVVDLSSSNGAAADLSVYMGSGFSDAGPISEERIFTMLEKLKQMDTIRGGSYG